MTRSTHDWRMRELRAVRVRSGELLSSVTETVTVATEMGSFGFATPTEWSPTSLRCPSPLRSVSSAWVSQRSSPSLGVRGDPLLRPNDASLLSEPANALRRCGSVRIRAASVAWQPRGLTTSCESGTAAPVPDAVRCAPPSRAVFEVARRAIRTNVAGTTISATLTATRAPVVRSRRHRLRRLPRGRGMRPSAANAHAGSI